MFDKPIVTLGEMLVLLCVLILLMYLTHIYILRKEKVKWRMAQTASVDENPSEKNTDLEVPVIIQDEPSRKPYFVTDDVPFPQKTLSKNELFLEKVTKYVEKNISRSDLSVEELSQELGISRVHFYKKLLAITGKTPIEFIRILRLKRAAKLLCEGRQNVSEIACQVGFNNPKYFSRYFKEEYGILPSAYQNKRENSQ